MCILKRQALVALTACLGLASALLEEPFVNFTPSESSVELQSASLVYDSSDAVGLSIAINSLAGDFEQITGTKPPVHSWTHSGQSNSTQLGRRVTNSTIAADFVVIAATVDSPLLRQLEDDGKVDVEDIRGKWETFRTFVVQNPLPGVSRGLVIAGSDKRGAMFGVYTLAEQSGQSPYVSALERQRDF